MRLIIYLTWGHEELQTVLVIHKELESDPNYKNNFMELSQHKKLSGYYRNNNQCRQQV